VCACGRGERRADGACGQRRLQPRGGAGGAQTPDPRITARLSDQLHQVIEAIPEADWTAISYWLEGAADVAETTYTPSASHSDAAAVRLIVRRVRPTPGSQLALLSSYDYHAFITDRDGDTVELEADHRRHAEIENAIRDLKCGVGLNRLPAGKFGGNGAWLAIQSLAHNLTRWTARFGLGAGIVTTKTLRRRRFSLPGRLASSVRRVTLHLPARWPWAADCTTVLQRLRALPLPTRPRANSSSPHRAWRQPCPHNRSSRVRVLRSDRQRP
jgi:hypothetical protein